MGAPNRGSRIKEDAIVLNRQLGSWELAKCCCLLSLLAGRKAICQTIVAGKLFLIHPLASEGPSWPSCVGHSCKWSVCLYTAWDVDHCKMRCHLNIGLWIQPCHEMQPEVIISGKENQILRKCRFEVLWYGTAHCNCIWDNWTNAVLVMSFISLSHEMSGYRQHVCWLSSSMNHRRTRSCKAYVPPSHTQTLTHTLHKNISK